MPAGRPSNYTPELADKVLALLEAGQDLKAILAADAELPGRTAWYAWLSARPDLDSRYREIRHAHNEEWLESIKHESKTVKTLHEFDSGKDGMRAISNSAAITKLDLQFRIAKFIGERLKPRIYGKDIAQAIPLVGNTPEERIESVLSLVRSGQIGVDEGNKIAQLIRSQLELKEYNELVATIDALTETVKQLKQGANYGTQESDVPQLQSQSDAKETGQAE